MRCLRIHRPSIVCSCPDSFDPKVEPKLYNFDLLRRQTFKTSSRPQKANQSRAWSFGIRKSALLRPPSGTRIQRFSCRFVPDLLQDCEAAITLSQDCESGKVQGAPITSGERALSRSIRSPQIAPKSILLGNDPVLPLRISTTVARLICLSQALLLDNGEFSRVRCIVIKLTRKSTRSLKRQTSVVCDPKLTGP